jgi:hypothetical protein
VGNSLIFGPGSTIPFDLSLTVPFDTVPFVNVLGNSFDVNAAGKITAALFGAANPSFTLCLDTGATCDPQAFLRHNPTVFIRSLRRHGQARMAEL